MTISHQDHNHKGDAAGCTGHGDQCPVRERLCHRGDHPPAIGCAGQLRSNRGVVDIALYAAGRTVPLGLFALGAIYKRATPTLLILGALAGAMQLLDAGIGLFEHDLGKCSGPLFIAVLQFFAVYLLHRSVRITPQIERG